MGERSKRHRDRHSDDDSGDERRAHKSSKHRSSKRIDLEQLGLRELTDDDYYARSSEFRAWLLNERGKYITDLKTEDSRYYFHKFVKAYNKGKLDSKYYDRSGALDAVLPSSVSSHKWSINRDDGEVVAAQEARDAVASSRGLSSSSSRPMPLDPSAGPSRSSTTVSDLQLRREAEQEARDAERDHARQLNRRDRREAKDEERDSRATGRDRLQEKRAERRGAHRDFANRNEGAGLEVDESILMGEDSFQAKLAERDRGFGKRDERRRQAQEEKQAVLNEKRAEFRSKEDKTMAMFKEMAAARFGGGAA